MSTLSLAPEDFRIITAFGTAGRSGDRSFVPLMIQMLRDPPPNAFGSAGQHDTPHNAYARNALHALAQLGTAEALPIFDEYVRGRNEDRSNFAEAVRARLLAEAHANDIPSDEARAQEKVGRFFQELDKSRLQLNEELYSYRHPTANFNAEGKRFSVCSNAPPVYPVAIHALRQLADIVYQGLYADFAALPDIILTHFREDYGSALKMRLAALPRSERLRRLVEELAQTQVMRAEPRHNIQLVINEGEEAGRLVAAKLEEMQANPSAYPHSGFSAMFDVLRGLGDTQYEPLVRRFLNQPLPANCRDIVYRPIRDGIPIASVSAY